MIHIAGGIILAVLGLRVLGFGAGLVAYSFETGVGQIVCAILALVVFAFGMSLYKGDGLEGGLAFLVIVGVGIAWCIYGKHYDNSSVDWRSQKPLGKRIR